MLLLYYANDYNDDRWRSCSSSYKQINQVIFLIFRLRFVQEMKLYKNTTRIIQCMLVISPIYKVNEVVVDQWNITINFLGVNRYKAIW